MNNRNFKACFWTHCIMACLFFLHTSAQVGNGYGNKNTIKPSQSLDRANELTRWMQKNLFLTVKQTPIIIRINQLYAGREDSVDNILKDRHVRIDAYASLKKNKDAEFKKILTDAQYRQYIEHKDFKPVLKRSPYTASDVE